MTFVVKCAPIIKEWKWCCCTCSLRAASIVLAWLTMIGNLMQFVGCMLYLTNPEMHENSPYGKYEQPQVAASFLTCYIGAIILDALLLYGIHRKKSMYMLPFLVMDLIALVVMSGGILVFTVLIIPHNWRGGIAILVIGSIFLAVATFFWVVHYSYYHQIEEEKNSNAGIVNYTYGIPSGDIQITTCREDDEKALCPYPTKTVSEVD